MFFLVSESSHTNVTVVRWICAAETCPSGWNSFSNFQTAICRKFYLWASMADGNGHCLLTSQVCKEYVLCGKTSVYGCGHWCLLEARPGFYKISAKTLYIFIISFSLLLFSNFFNTTYQYDIISSYIWGWHERVKVKAVPHLNLYLQSGHWELFCNL